MAVVQQAFYVPPEIAKMVAKGDYRIYGGVVRWAVGKNKGRIVKHLKPVDVQKAEAAKGVAAKAADVIKHNKVGAIAVGVGAAAVVGGGIAYKAVANKRRQKVETEEIRAFKKTLDRYLTAIQKGNMTEELIDEMSKALADLKMFSLAADRIKVEITLEQLSDVIKTINDYTHELARNNNYDLDKEEIGDNDKFLDFQKCLMAQKRIFEEAA